MKKRINEQEKKEWGIEEKWETNRKIKQENMENGEQEMENIWKKKCEKKKRDKEEKGVT